MDTMRRLKLVLVLLILGGTAQSTLAQQMDKMWGEQVMKLKAADAERGQIALAGGDGATESRVVGSRNGSTTSAGSRYCGTRRRARTSAPPGQKTAPTCGCRSGRSSRARLRLAEMRLVFERQRVCCSRFRRTGPAHLNPTQRGHLGAKSHPTTSIFGQGILR